MITTGKGLARTDRLVETVEEAFKPKYYCFWCDRKIEPNEMVKLNIPGYEGKEIHKQEVIAYMIEEGLLT